MTPRVPRSRLRLAAIWLTAALVAAGCQELFPRRTPGARLYHRLCAQCHGADGAGNTPRYMGNAWADLTDDQWRHGGDPGSIEQVIRDGIFGEMPAHPELSELELRQLTDHLLSLRGETRGGP